MIDVMAELKGIGEQFKSGDFSSALDSLQVLWNAVPEPKEDTPNVYLIIEYAVAISMKKGDLEGAWNWAVLAPEYNKRRQDLGEAEFLVGKVALEKGDVETAKQNFVIANEKSHGRIFRGENPKYKAVIKGRAKE